MKVSCACCSGPFIVQPDEEDFYQKIGVPAPAHCPDCREMQRMAWCNEGVLYQSSCGLCGKAMISQYPASARFPVYCVHCWWSERWNAASYAAEASLKRPFFKQLHELSLRVPHCATNTDTSNENSEYTHHAGHEKNCFMTFHCSFAEDCYFGYGVKKARDCVDTHYCHESELCYECIDVQKCYDLAWCQDCHACSSSRFLFDCRSVKNCFLCVGLRNREYCFLNQQLSKADYERRVAAFDLGSRPVLAELQQRLEALRLSQPQRNLQMHMVENSVGNHLTNARESRQCFDCSDIEFSKYCSQLQLGTRSCQDIYQFGLNIELCFNCSMVGYQIYNCHYCYDLLENCSDLEYCISCHATKDSFGCYGLKGAQYCILNRQYQKDDYQQLRAKIVERMTADGDYGVFLPIWMSPHGYNETMAQEWYPKSQAEVEAKGWRWETNLPFSTGRATVPSPPETLDAVPANSEREIYSCTTCSRDFKIIEQELQFHLRNHFALPDECFPCRRQRRAGKREPRQLWLRSCAKCGADMPTTVAPTRPETVYCETCYAQHVV